MSVEMLDLNVTVFRPGRFGTALLIPLAENVRLVTVYLEDPEANRIFQETQENQKYFPGVKLPNNIHSTNNLQESLQGANVILMTTPTKHFRGVAECVLPIIPRDGIVICGSKGIEEGTNMRMSQVIKDVNPNFKNKHLAVMSGPNFAHEIIRGLPAATVIASENDRLTRSLQRLFRTNRFLPYRSDDVIGVELGGALKNPISLAVGVCNGMGLGDNATAALMNRGLREMIRLAVRLGADERTLIGLTGDADLSLSSRCGGRNYDAGVAIGKGENPELLLQSDQTIEAISTIKAVVSLAKRKNVRVPIMEGVYGMIYGGLKPMQVLDMLIERYHDYEGPLPIIDRRIGLPLRLFNRLLHRWDR